MKIAILGATSEIAKDLIRSFSSTAVHECVLFARRPDAVRAWQFEQCLSARFPVYDFGFFSGVPDFDVIINFVGAGNPALTASMGASMLDVTATYDEMALSYVRNHPSCRYIFLSSGAVYGDAFDSPITIDSHATFPLNSPRISNWYSIAKFYAEMRHRALPSLSITDIRVFSYISRYQDVNSRFLIMDMVRAIKSSSVLKTAKDNITRDYLSPSDFCQMIAVALDGPNRNTAIDCFSKAPVDKYSLLEHMAQTFGLSYEFESEPKHINITGLKANYYSTNHLAGEIGYTPQKTALEAVVDELGAMFSGEETTYPKTKGNVNDCTLTLPR